MIHLITALQCEARPLVARFRLKSVSARGFHVYTNENMSLTVSGMGKTAAAAAVGHAQGSSSGTEISAWLNVGVAGHREHDPGSGFMAGRIRDRATGRSWFPVPVIDASAPLAEVLTVDEVEREYEEDWLYEMEAAGFFPAAIRFSTAELVHCYKIVSDNAAKPPERLSSERIEALVESCVPAIDELVEQLADVREAALASRRPPAELKRFLERWRFTATQRKQLARLLQRWQALNPGQALWTDELGRLHNGTEVLARIGQLVEARAAQFELSA